MQYGILELNEVYIKETKETKDSNGKAFVKFKMMKILSWNYSDNGNKVSVSGLDVRRGSFKLEYETIENNKNPRFILLKASDIYTIF